MKSLPWLGIARAWVLGARRAQQSQQALDAVEKNVENAPDSPDKQRLKGYIAAARAYTFDIQGNKSTTIAYARQANELLPADEVAVRSLNLTIWGDVLNIDHYDPASMPLLEEALALGLQAKKPHVAMIAAMALASAHLNAGRLHEVQHVFQRMSAIAEEYQSRTQRPLSAMAGIYSLMGRTFAEWGEHEKAVHFTRKGVLLSERWGQVENDVICLAYLGRALVFGNEWAQARQVYQRAYTAAQKISAWHWQMISMYILDSLLDSETPDANEIAQQMHRVQESEARYPIPLQARLLLRENQPADALALLEQALKDLNGQPSLDTVRLLALRALAFQAQGNEKQALASLRQALELGEPENRVMSFVREGAAMEKLLRQEMAKSSAPAFIKKLLTAFAERRAQTPTRAVEGLLEPLSEREVEVLRLLAQGLPNKKIAETLVIARETVHKHLKNIYGKLDVHSRAEAILRAGTAFLKSENEG